MRALIILSLSFGVGYGLIHSDALRPILEATALVEPEPHPDHHRALELRCGELDGWRRSECETHLVARFDSGDSNPESILRRHCTRVYNVWQQAPTPTPPAVCRQRFGGWLAG
jgi:hypothetical protein